MTDRDPDLAVKTSPEMLVFSRLIRDALPA